MPIEWEAGVIGKTETFLLDRFPIGKMLARAIPASFISLALSNAILPDEWGPVKPNLWYFYIGRSGFAFKTPVIKFIRQVILNFDRHLFSVPKFTPEGFTEYVCGTLGSKKKERKQVKAHPVNYICRDEISKLLGSRNQKYQSELGEYMSELWDGYIEGYYTRSHQYEGNTPVYVVAFFAGSEYFYELLDQTFFTQGLGNRPLWLVGEDREPKKLDKDFFFSFGEEDKELSDLRISIVDSLNEIRRSSRMVYVTPGANELWRLHQYDMAMQAYKGQSLEGMLKMKLALNALKLSIVYAASCFSFRTADVVIIRTEDMVRAIDDVKIHEKMWQLAIERWNVLRGDAPTPTHMSDFQKVHYYIKKFGGKISPAKLQQSTKWLSTQQREICNSMIEAGEIKIKIEKTKTKPATFYVEVKGR